MATIINVADLRDPDDPKGRSYRQVNAERQHTILIGALVELRPDDDGKGGVRLFVVHHGRDCDQTPLYYLSHDPGDTVQEREGWRNRSWVGGFSEDSLSVIREPLGAGG